MPAQPPRPTYDPWLDAHGAQIPQHCWIEQVSVDKGHGALPSRLHKQGQVIGRGTTRVTVRFADENGLVHLRPHLVRVLETPSDLTPIAADPREPIPGEYPVTCAYHG